MHVRMHCPLILHAFLVHRKIGAKISRSKNLQICLLPVACLKITYFGSWFLSTIFFLHILVNWYSFDKHVIGVEKPLGASPFDYL